MRKQYSFAKSRPSPYAKRLKKQVTGRKRFLLCIRNTRCEDLELRKLYEQIPDRRAAQEGYVRVVDESEEDYLYPVANFIALKLPPDVQRALAKCSRKRSAA